MSRLHRSSTAERGQAMAEFAIAIMVFMVMLIAVFDLGKGIYMYNGVAEAARELSRATSVNLGSPVGTSAKTADVIATQRGLTPGLGTPVFSCTDLYGATGTCSSGNYVTVSVTAAYDPVSFLGMLAPVTLSSTSSAQIP